MKTKKVLPTVPSELLEIAIEDVKKSVNQGVKINMLDWIVTDSKGDVCSVCLAGAVMLQTSEKITASRIINLYPDPSGVNHRAYRFLDKIRKGDIISALNNLWLGEDFVEKSLHKDERLVEIMLEWKQNILWKKEEIDVLINQLTDLKDFFKSVNY